MKMNKKISFVIVSVLILQLSLSSISMSTSNVTNENNDPTTDFTHTVFAEYGTTTWCSYCKYAHEALKNIYSSGEYPFYYVTLVCDKVDLAEDHVVDNYNKFGYPTVWFDGGYQVVVGSANVSSAQSTFENNITVSGSRSVPNIDIDLEVMWLGGTEMEINISVHNNDIIDYEGFLRVYITEIVSSRNWKDSAGHLYTFPFLDFAFNNDLSIGTQSSWVNSTTWDGTSHGFSTVTGDNIQITAVVFNDEWHQGYSDPPDDYPFDAYYVDEVAAATPINVNTPPIQPSTPFGSDLGVIETDYIFSTSTIDPDGDQLYYQWSWGDGQVSEWLGPYASGQTVTASHQWDDLGEYEITVKAKDELEALSPISEQTIIEIIYSVGGVELSCDDPYHTFTSQQGATTNFTVVIKNLGNHDDTFNITASSIEDLICYVNGVQTDTPYPITVPVGSQTTFTVTVEQYIPGLFGEFPVIVQARSQTYSDVFDDLTLIVNITPPPKTILEIINPVGGFGKISAEIKNNGPVDAEFVEWSILAFGGMFGRIDVPSNGTIPLLKNNETIQITTDTPILGFGKTAITISIEANNADRESEIIEGFVFLFYILI